MRDAGGAIETGDLQVRFFSGGKGHGLTLITERRITAGPQAGTCLDTQISGNQASDQAALTATDGFTEIGIGQWRCAQAKYADFGN
ncbi:hypothetical protein D3C86_1649840 [compost metagenome]